MKFKKKSISLTLLMIFVLTLVACSGSKKTCPAYSRTTTEKSAVHPG
jgi:hypothetical protein